MTTAFERHFRVKELAELWGMSSKTIIRIFSGEPGVLRPSGPGSTISIPESVALRVHERLISHSHQKGTVPSNPPRVIRLRELGLTKKASAIIRLTPSRRKKAGNDGAADSAPSWGPGRSSSLLKVGDEVIQPSEKRGAF